MTRKCPSCGSINTRRSSTPAAEMTWRNDFLSRYRCRDCMLQFWVISRKTYLIAVGFVVAIVAIVLTVLLFELLASRQSLAPKQQRRSDALPQVRVLAVADTRFDSGASNAL
jgi:tetrahydromethanopterin S-methyltransferase subunit F